MMGTRYYIGYKKDNKVKVVYGQYDGYAVAALARIRAFFICAGYRSNADLACSRFSTLIDTMFELKIAFDGFGFESDHVDKTAFGTIRYFGDKNHIVDFDNLPKGRSFGYPYYVVDFDSDQPVIITNGTYVGQISLNIEGDHTIEKSISSRIYAKKTGEKPLDTLPSFGIRFSEAFECFKKIQNYELEIDNLKQLVNTSAVA